MAAGGCSCVAHRRVWTCCWGVAAAYATGCRSCCPISPAWTASSPCQQLWRAACAATAPDSSGCATIQRAAPGVGPTLLAVSAACALCGALPTASRRCGRCNVVRRGGRLGMAVPALAIGANGRQWRRCASCLMAYRETALPAANCTVGTATAAWIHCACLARVTWPSLTTAAAAVSALSVILCVCVWGGGCRAPYSSASAAAVRRHPGEWARDQPPAGGRQRGTLPITAAASPPQDQAAPHFGWVDRIMGAAGREAACTGGSRHRMF
jgi:hypothetical protein